MRDYKDIANSVFRRREEYEKEKSRKKAVFIRRTSIALSCCLMLTVCFGIWRMNLLDPIFGPNGENKFDMTDPPTADYTDIVTTTDSSTTAASPLASATTEFSGTSTKIKTVTPTSSLASSTSTATTTFSHTANTTAADRRTTASYTEITRRTSTTSASRITVTTTPEAFATDTNMLLTTTRYTSPTTATRTTMRTTTARTTTARTTSRQPLTSATARPTTTYLHTTTTTRTTITGIYTTITAMPSQTTYVSSTVSPQTTYVTSAVPPQNETLTGFTYRGSLYTISDRYDSRPNYSVDPVLYTGKMELNGDVIPYSVYLFDGITEEFICSVSTESGTQRYICVNTKFVPTDTQRCLNSMGICDYMDLTYIYSSEMQSYRSALEGEKTELISLLKELDGSLTSYSQSDNYLRRQAADSGWTYPDTDLSQYSVAFGFEMPEIIDPDKYFGSGYIAFTNSGEMIFELLDYKYTFDIGEKAAEKIISSFG
ncbi:MAG: hypothetical protein J5724_01875 [Ruminococcus sp.]|nr:hypothetical protein [Ruminococcus sp.]